MCETNSSRSDDADGEGDDAGEGEEIDLDSSAKETSGREADAADRAGPAPERERPGRPDGAEPPLPNADVDAVAGVGEEKENDGAAVAGNDAAAKRLLAAAVPALLLLPPPPPPNEKPPEALPLPPVVRPHAGFSLAVLLLPNEKLMIVTMR